MPKQVRNKTVYLAVHLSETPEDRGLALKILRKFGDITEGVPPDFDYGNLADEITTAEDWIIQHPSGMVTFLDQEAYEREFETA